MKRFLKFFIRNIENTEDPQVRLSVGRFAGIAGIITNLLLVGAKLLIGFLAGSISIFADALNNLADAGSAILTLVGFHLSGKPADEEHPYGHARIEYVTGLMISMSVLFIGFQLAMESIGKIRNPEETKITAVTLIVLCIAIAVKLLQGLFYRKIGEIIASQTLKATASDSFNDVILTCTVLVGAILTRITGWTADGWFGLAASLFILTMGVKLIRETSDPLLGVSPSKDLVHSVSEKILSYRGILGIHDLVVHSYGAHKTFISAHAEVDANENVLDSHELLDRIELAFKQELNIDLVLHLDPIVTDDERVHKLKNQVNQILNTRYPDIHFHDFRVVFGKDTTNVIFDIVVPVKFPETDGKLAGNIRKDIQNIQPHLNVVITVDRDYGGTAGKGSQAANLQEQPPTKIIKYSKTIQ